MLVGHEVVPAHDLLAWARFFETADRVVASDAYGPIVISTVFLGVDHGVNPQRPVLFETMVFNDSGSGLRLENTEQRYCTWDEAIRGHNRIKRAVRRELVEQKETT